MIGYISMPGCFEWLVILFMGVLAVVPFWKICLKVGYPGPLSLLVLVPLLNILFIYYLAFVEWPLESRLAACERQRAPGIADSQR